MSLLPGIKARLFQMHQYRLGVVPLTALQGFIHAIEKQQGHGIKVPDLLVSFKTAQTSTSASVLASAGRLYGMWVKSPAAATLAVIVKVTDNDVAVGSVKVKATKAGEVYFFAGDDGIGIPCATDIEVIATAAADGTSNPAAGDRPDIVVIYGDDATNSE